MRIVAVSDQHGHFVEIPPCDLLIVAGDICPDQVGPFFASAHPDQQKSWFDRRFRPWAAKAPARHRVATWGNHDWCGQVFPFRQDSPAMAAPGDLQIVVDEPTRVPRHGPTRTDAESPYAVNRGGAAGQEAAELVVWATPWSNQIMQWAFMKSPGELAAIYDAIPEGIDILVSHQPPFGHGDRYTDPGSGSTEDLGSQELLSTIDRVRPRLVICGHIHSGFGRYEYHGIPIYNVSVVDDRYELAHPPTVIDFE